MTKTTNERPTESADPETLDTQTTDRRRILNLRTAGMRHALTLGRFNYKTAEEPLPEQQHKSWTVLVFVLRGNQHYRIDGCDLDIRGGQGLCIRPGETYSTGEQPEQRGDLAWLIIKTTPVPKGRPFGLGVNAAREIFTRFTDTSLPRVFKLSTGMGNLVSATFRAWDMPEGVLRTEFIRHQIAALVLESALALEARLEPPKHTEARIGSALEWLRQNIDSSPTAEDLAGQAKISRNHFYDEFKRLTGTTPGDYILRLRVCEAAARLAQNPGLGVTDVAFDLGFSSSQYFATVFRRYLGDSPSQWRKRGQSPPSCDFVR